MSQHRKSGIFFKINGQEVAKFQSVWVKSKIINSIKCTTMLLISKTWCEQYIECIINVFSHLRNKL